MTRFVAVNTIDEMKALISELVATPKKPNQVPPGDVADTVGDPGGTDFDEDQDDSDEDDENELETPDDDTSDFD